MLHRRLDARLTGIHCLIATHSRRRNNILHDDNAAVVLHSSSIHLRDRLPRARPLDQQLGFPADSAAQQSSHDLSLRNFILNNPTALPLHEHFIDAGTRAAANNDAVPTVHFILHAQFQIIFYASVTPYAACSTLTNHAWHTQRLRAHAHGD